MKFSVKLEEIAKAIEEMRIRGATPIARAAAEALIIEAEESRASTPDEFIKEMDGAARRLLSTRPTAVSLPNAVRFIMFRVLSAYRRGAGLEDLRKISIEAGREFLRRVDEAKKVIAKIGSKRIVDGDIILTHCNSSAVIAILTEAKRQGKDIKVIATETRPKFQGRLTAMQLAEAGIPVTLIVDSAARFFMKKVDKVFVGADAVASNGAVVNKIGTSMIALAAKEARVRVFVAAETYKFSPETIIGELIKIEERSPDEVVSKEFLERYPLVSVRNPSFDVTPPDYIDLIITEKGIIPPQAAYLIIQSEISEVGYDDYMRYTTYLEES
ncbi:ribose 1,5-bisphosphate isomerase [Candidatus Bathyarchaeota archaeon]|nr:ribose 1,5-bisphosphate isomerase [Candidatus Bathyarchaeota archaeon]